MTETIKRYNANSVVPRKSAFWDSYTPFGIGIERMFDQLDSFVKGDAVGYPPHNIIKVDDHRYQVEMAVAGFSRDDLKIEQMGNELSISATKPESSDDIEYIHRGLGKRPFTKHFTLADDVRVLDSALADGILTINLELVVPEHKQPKTIEIH